jgi:hypothetical protein
MLLSYFLSFFDLSLSLLDLSGVENGRYIPSDDELEVKTFSVLSIHER